MVAKEVVSYVQQLKANGYSMQAIRQNLLQAGYREKDVNAALRASAGGGIKFVPQHHVKAIVAGSAAGLLVLILLMIIIIPTRPSFSLETSIQNNEVVAGERISFSSNFDFKKEPKEDIVMEYEIIAPETLDLISTSKESIDVTSFATSKVNVPSDLTPGRYLMRTTASASGFQATDAFSFRVVVPQNTGTTTTPSVPTTNDPVIDFQEPETLSCNDLDPCTDDSVVNGVCVYKEKPVCCGDYVCDFELGESSNTCSRDCAARPKAKKSEDIIQDALDTADSDKGRAVSLCQTLAQVSDADQCYDGVARGSGDSEICGGVKDSRTKDSCYLFFAINKDEFDVCPEVEDSTLQSSCYSFKNLHQIQQASS
jgi:hypothetical protein